MKRSEYLDAYDGGESGAKLHRAYYAQFVTDEVREHVARCVGPDRIRASKDPHFNDIPLEKWDRVFACVGMPRQALAAAMLAVGDYIAPAGGTCVLKEAAKQIREARWFEVRAGGKLEGVFYLEQTAKGYAAELRSVGARDVTVMPER